MPPKQIPITFEDEPPKGKTKRKMQSEEDWTPKSDPAAETPSSADSDVAADEAPAKPKRVTRGRKPRASKATEGKKTTATQSAEEPRETGEPEKRSEPGEPKKEQEPEPARAESGAPPEAREDRPERPDSSEKRRGDGGDDGNSTAPEKPERSFRNDRDRGGPPRGRGGDSRKFGDQQRSGNKKGKKKKKGRFGGDGGGGGGGSDMGRVAAGQPSAAGVPDPSRFRNLEELEDEAAALAEGGEPVRLHELYDLTLHDLAARAQEMGVIMDSAPNRRTLVSLILEKAREDKRPIIDRGSLELSPKGYGFIVRHAFNYRLQPEDSYVAENIIRHFGLKKGHQVEAQVRPPEANERCPAVLKVNEVMGKDPKAVADVTPFEDLVPYYPLERVLLEMESEENTRDVSMRAVDLLTPIGFGQRGLIVAPPRTGKTVLLQQIANSVAANKPNANLIVLLIDERPEEVTDFRRNVRGEVVSSTFDEPAESHVQVAEMVIEKARRLVEAGEHVVILLDSITRLARAYNTMMPSSGKILSGGVEANALQKPKRFFGAARNIEGGGSLTILATALIDTGSRMDEVIFEEFKGTGNMELHLDRALVDKRVFPALNIEKSGTRKEELLYHPDEMNRIYSLRRAIQGVPMVEAMEMLVQRLKKTRTNVEFLMAMNR